MKFKLILLTIVVFILFLFLFPKKSNQESQPQNYPSNSILEQHPLMIEQMRQRNYFGSDLVIEQVLEDGSNYYRYIASYLSDSLKVFGLLTVPMADKPKDGWPVIIFNHGYIPPAEYRTTERYSAYTDAFSKDGYIVFKSDYRGNGNSEGQPEGAYYSPAYTTDVLNALSSLKKYPGVNLNKIGMWGHSLGGNITLRALVVSPDIKAAVIWGGVVGTYDDLMNHWQRRVPYQPPQRELALRNRFRSQLLEKYGSPSANPVFWQSLDPNYNLQYVQAPVSLHTGLSDEEVPWQFSQGLADRLKKAGKAVEFYTYGGADHNISDPAFNLAIQRSVEFFDKYLKPN